MGPVNNRQQKWEKVAHMQLKVSGPSPDRIMPASSQLISQPQENLLPLRVSENEKDPPIQDLRSSPVPDQLLVLAPSLKIWRHNPATISTLTYTLEDILQAFQGTSNPELLKDLFFVIGSPRAV